ncbi:MAG: carbamoyltransferase [Flavobacteriaceae bacterium]|nr:carbamoyltransferase [Flavobacteriaceae bacterium]
MYILGISDSHESHACLLKDGKLISCIAEERLNRIKGYVGYPKLAIEKVLKITKIRSNDIDHIVVASYNAGIFQLFLKPTCSWTPKDWVDQHNNYWKPKLLKNKRLSPLDDFNFNKKKISNIRNNPYFEFIKKTSGKKFNYNKFSSILQSVRKETVIKHLKVTKDKVSFIKHETCHQYYGYFSQVNFKNKKSIVLTLEGGGDESSATISEFKQNSYQEIYKTNDAMFGRIYRYITLLLGMKPCQHEYKVMGLAPYSSEYHGIRSLKFFNSFHKIKGHKIYRNKKIKDVYETSKINLEGERFDGIAWGLQKSLEDFVLLWVNNIIKKFKCKNIVLSGGVAQNIKLIKFLNEKSNAKHVWAGPISGDGSLAIGACWAKLKTIKPKIKILGLNTIYLGSEFDQSQTENIIKQAQKKFKVVKNISNKKIAKWLSEGLIIARCNGKMEFGQRALGNRSILADPRNHSVLDKINQKIKFRDFWMPFTPTILNEDISKFIINKNKLFSPFMTMAFSTNKFNKNKIIAAVHPADQTTRPQMLRKEENKEYFDLIKEFKKLTGVGALLNTSYNLHGEAIVENPKQAYNTFLRSDLDILVIGKYAIIRKTNKRK